MPGGEPAEVQEDACGEGATDSLCEVPENVAEEGVLGRGEVHHKDGCDRYAVWERESVSGVSEKGRLTCLYIVLGMDVWLTTYAVTMVR